MKILDSLDPPHSMGRPRIDQRQALNGIVHRARTVCQWNQVPREFGDDSSLHRTFQRWERCGVLDELRDVLVKNCDELNGSLWNLQVSPGIEGRSRRGRRCRRKDPEELMPKTAQDAA